MTKRDAILAEYDKFVREKQAFLMKLRTILESELTITVQMLDDVPKVDEAVKTILPAEESTPAPPAQENPPPEPVEEPPATVEPAHDDNSNIVDMVSKPVTDETKTYTPVKIDKESST